MRHMRRLKEQGYVQKDMFVCFYMCGYTKDGPKKTIKKKDKKTLSEILPDESSEEEEDTSSKNYNGDGIENQVLNMRYTLLGALEASEKFLRDHWEDHKGKTAEARNKCEDFELSLEGLKEGLNVWKGRVAELETAISEMKGEATAA